MVLRPPLELAIARCRALGGDSLTALAAIASARAVLVVGRAGEARRRHLGAHPGGYTRGGGIGPGEQELQTRRLSGAAPADSTAPGHGVADEAVGRPTGGAVAIPNVSVAFGQSEPASPAVRSWESDYDQVITAVRSIGASAQGDVGGPDGRISRGVMRCHSEARHRSLLAGSRNLGSARACSPGAVSVPLPSPSSNAPVPVSTARAAS